MSDDQDACCPHLTVSYNPEHLPNGTERERWTCDTNGCEFVPRLYVNSPPAAEGRIEELRHRAEKAEARVVELESDLAWWRLRAEFLITEAVADHWLKTKFFPCPNEEDSVWVKMLDTLIVSWWPHAIPAGLCSELPEQG